MSKQKTRSFIRLARAAAAALLFLLTSAAAYAVPSFGRQTGQPCASCHTVFPELTPFGRQFKLRGYALGSQLDDKKFPFNLPLSASLIGSHTSIRDKQASDPGEDFPRAGKTILQTAAVYYAGKITDSSGAFVQYGWDGIERRWAIEMADVRYANSTTLRNQELLVGVSLNNSPGVQDVWNSTLMWSFPHLESAGVMVEPEPLLDMALAAQAAGPTLYAFWNNTLYAEIGAYRTASRGWLRPFSLGVPRETEVDGYAPYWHLMWNRDMGNHSVAAGIKGMTAKIFPEPRQASGPTDRFRDVSLEAQYQYVGVPHIFTADATWIREKRDWDASFPMGIGMASNRSDTLHSFKANVHYYWQRRAGLGLGYFRTRGSTDMLQYGMEEEMEGPSAMGNVRGKPDTRGWLAELNYLPLKDAQNVKLGLRYTAYTKFNGARNDYNGFGRDASDNNSIFGYVWLIF